MSGTLGDFIAKGVVTIALVSDGNETLEDLGIECLTPGQTIIKCLDAKAVKPVEQASAYIEEWDKGSAEWVLSEYASGRLLRDVDRDCDVEIALVDARERIEELERECAEHRANVLMLTSQKPGIDFAHYTIENLEPDEAREFVNGMYDQFKRDSARIYALERELEREKALNGELLDACGDCEQLMEANANVERYRAACGRILDLADEMFGEGWHDER